jgi:hypothetical protein
MRNPTFVPKDSIRRARPAASATKRRLNSAPDAQSPLVQSFQSSGSTTRKRKPFTLRRVLLTKGLVSGLESWRRLATRNEKPVTAGARPDFVISRGWDTVRSAKREPSLIDWPVTLDALNRHQLYSVWRSYELLGELGGQMLSDAWSFNRALFSALDTKFPLMAPRTGRPE